MHRDPFVTGVEEVAAAGRAACEAIGAAVRALETGAEARTAGVPLVQIVDELIGSGGRDLRLAAADAFHQFERVTSEMRARVVRALIDEDRLSLTPSWSAPPDLEAGGRPPVPTRAGASTGGVTDFTFGYLWGTSGCFIVTNLSGPPVSSTSAGDTGNSHVVTPAAALMVEAIPHIVWTASLDGAVTYFNDQGTDFTGCSREAAYDWDWVTLVHPDDAERARDGWQAAVRSEVEFALDYRIRRFDGEYRWHACRARPVRDREGRIDFWIGTATDIDARKQLEHSLRRSERDALETVALLRSIEASAPVGFKLVDRDLCVVRVNETLAAISGKPADELVGRTVRETMPELWPQIEDAYRRALAGETVCGLDLSTAAADAPWRVRHWLASYYPVRIDDEIIGVGNVVVDITESRDAEEFLRIVVDNMVEGLYALDGDGLVTFVNPAASKMLGWTEAELLGRSMHEMVHFQRGDAAELPSSECPIARVAETGRPVRVSDDAFVCRDGTVLPVAYSAAALGGGVASEGVVVVFRDITEQKKERAILQRELSTLSWIGRIRDALDEDRFVLYSQPIVPLTGGRPSEELLVRMIGRNGEVILPGTFLPVAERYGLVSEIDRWVVTQAVRLAATSGRQIEANLSAASIEAADLVPFIERLIKQEGADPANLVFELTETALMKDLTAGTEFARGLREIGCGLALDDFGTGYGSFTYLKNLPLTYVKIDIDFVRDLATNPANRHVVAAIASLAQAFGLQTIAEGVENEETLTLLRSIGVDFAQGYHVGRPNRCETTPTT